MMGMQPAFSCLQVCARDAYYKYSMLLLSSFLLVSAAVVHREVFAPILHVIKFKVGLASHMEL